MVGASVRAAAQSALAAGFEVVAADLFADHDLAAICPATRIDRYPDGLADWLTDQSVDAWFYTGALENYPKLVDQMARIAPLWGAAGETLRRARDPLVLAGLFGGAGVGFAETLPIGVSPPPTGDWLAKTYGHSAGVGVWRYGEHPAKARVYAQRYVGGSQRSAVFALADEQCVLLGVTEQLLSSGSDAARAFSYRGSVGPIACSQAVDGQLTVVGEVLRNELGLRGVVGVDFIEADNAMVVIEINPRWTASIEVLERATGRSAFDLHAQCFAIGGFSGQRIPPWRQAGHGETTCGKQVLFAERDVVVSTALAEWATAEAHAGRLADLPSAGQAINAEQPVCTVLVEGQGLHAVHNALRAFTADAERRLYL